MYIKILAILCVVLGILLIPLFTVIAAEKPLVIHEVGFKEENDFVEIKVLEQGDYSGFGIYEGSVKIAEIPLSWDVLVNDLIVIYENQGEDDLEKSDNDEACFELFGAGSLVGTDNIIQIKDLDGDVVDVLIYSNLSHKFTGNKTESNYALDFGFWEGDVSFSTTSDESAWTDSDELLKGQSLNRAEVNEINSAADFEISDVSPGFEPEERFISEKIEISELFPNPLENEAENEFIELYNPEDQDVNLQDYLIKDNSRSYTIVTDDFKNTIIKATAYFVLERAITGIALNNTSEQVELLTPDDQRIDSVSYQVTKEGLSYAKKGDSFFWTKKITKGAENIIEEEKEDPIDDPVVDDSKSSTNEPVEPAIPKGPYSKDIVISEILPNPSGPESESEWIEIYNKGSIQVDLSYWQLDDMEGGSKPFQIPTKTTISPGQYLVFYNKTTHIALNNSEDTARLLHPDGVAVSSVDYEETAKEDLSFARNNDGNFLWTSKITPGTKNEFQLELGGDGDEGSKDEEENKNTIPEGPYSKDIYINEILPNPSGSESEEEWIELHNKSDHEVNLAYFRLDDAEKGSKSYLIPENTVIEAKGYVLFKNKETKISLSNSGDMARLLFPDGSIASQLKYDKSAKENVSLARKENGFFGWTLKPTPGAVNIIEKVLSAAAKKKSSSTKKSTAKKNPTRDELQVVPIAEALKKEKGEFVKVEGIVSVEPGMLSVRYFYFQDNTAGIQVYKSKGDLPGVKIGDKVEVFGKISISKGEKRILIKEIDDVVVKENNQQFDVEVIKTGDGNKNHLLSKVVRIRAKLLKAEGNVLYFDDGSGRIMVTISKGSKIKAKDFIEGMEYEIIGLIHLKDGQVVLTPRFKDDVILLTHENNEELKGDALEAADNLPFKSSKIWLITGIVSAVLALCYGGWQVYQRRFAKKG